MLKLASLGHWGLIQTGSQILLHDPNSPGQLPCSLGLAGTLPVISSRSSDFFQWQVPLRNQGLGTRGNTASEFATGF